MEKIVSKDFGVEILLRRGRYFIRYDAGEIVVQMKELPISESAARRAQMSEEDAYQVVLNAERETSTR